MKRTEFEALEESWDVLKNSSLPVCIYGTGNACEKILAEFEKRQIKCSGIFASEGFVRDRNFCGFKVKSLSDIEKEFAEFIVCCAFGSSLPDVMNTVEEISKRHKLVFPDLPIAEEEYFSKSGLLERFDKAEQIYSSLADEQSRIVFKNVLKFKISGDISFLSGIFTDPKDDLSSIISPGKNEAYVDLGGYNGDTVIEFLKQTNGEYDRVYVFEPDKRSFRKCLRNLNDYDNISFINSCAWSCDKQMCFSQSGGRQSQITDRGALVSARSVDSVIGEKRCTVIKYDVEGAEKMALYGSVNTIRRNSPKLIISAYHRPYDLIDIPIQLYDIDSGYRLYIRQRRYYPAWDTLIYAKK
ncbi:MAG: FkbM family methyltransferase [Oscillospiraceae bacterium]